MQCMKEIKKVQAILVSLESDVISVNGDGYNQYGCVPRLICTYSVFIVF
jgi:hypothetical protein